MFILDISKCWIREPKNDYTKHTITWPFPFVSGEVVYIGLVWHYTRDELELHIGEQNNKAFAKLMTLDGKTEAYSLVVDPATFERTNEHA